jgi:hypothetical protein
MMITQTGTFQTEHASKYLQQLCKHFAHKVDVTYDENRGEAALPPGPATLQASNTALSVTISGETSEQRETARHVIDIHLQKFAFREEFEVMQWSEPVGN